MTEPTFPSRGAPVPAGRIARMTRIGGMVTGVAGGVAMSGARQLLQGERPSLRDLVFTPANARRVAKDLARMRGAAMKLGQLLSLDDGAVLPPELAEVFARLRETAQPMPPKQLKSVLTAEWGRDFTRHFKRFDPHPLACASIGQVHRATTRDGCDLAIKVQYPGVRESIDSDLSTLGGMMRIPGLVPAGSDLTGLLNAARQRLHEEADYLREAEHLAQFAALLEGDPDFVVPDLHRDLTTGRVLAMSFVASEPIETVAQAPQADRDRVIARMITLMMRELFEFQLMQTDPNFANYRYQTETGRIVLLDFGATVAFADPLVAQARTVLAAAFSGQIEDVGEALSAMGLVDPMNDPGHYSASMELVGMAMEPLASDRPFDIACSDLTTRLIEAGFAIPPEQALRHLPPHDLLFLQRKIAGLYLLAARLQAQIPVRSLLAPHL